MTSESDKYFTFHSHYSLKPQQTEEKIFACMCRSEPEQGAAAGDAKDAGTDDRSLAPEEAPARSGRSTRRSLVAVQPAQEAAPRPARGRRTSLALAADNNPRKEVPCFDVLKLPAPGASCTNLWRLERKHASDLAVWSLLIRVRSEVLQWREC